MRSSTLILIASIVMAVSTCCQPPDRAQSARKETYSLELKHDGELQATTFNGSINVEGWDREEVSLVAEIREKRQGDIAFSAESKDGRVEITAGRKNQRTFALTFGGSNGVSYTLRIPSKAVARLQTSNGRVEVRRMDGDVYVNTSNGRITAERIGGRAQLRTSNGSIRTQSIMGDLFAQTSNGNNEVKGAQGNVDLRTSNGRIEVRDVLGNAEVNTSNGAVIAELIGGDLTGSTRNSRVDIQKVSGAIDLSTSNGSIKADGLDGKGKGISLATTNGSIDVTLGQAEGMLEARAGKRNRVHLEIPNIQPTVDGSTTRAKIGTGDQAIELKTTNGRITVR